jgi:hypothetical protein
LDTERKGDVTIGFFGLKSGELNPPQLKKTKAMPARFDPQGKAKQREKREPES